MNVAIDNKELSMTALNGLPSSYETLIIAVDSPSNDETIFTFDLMRTRLRQYAQTVIECEKSVSDSKLSALYGASSKTGGPQKGRKKLHHKYSNHYCENCDNFGHSAKVCLGRDINGARPPNSRSDEKTRQNNALLIKQKASTNPAMNQKRFVRLMPKISTSAFPKRKSFSIADTGCTSHICLDQSMVHCYKTVTDMSVEIGTKDTVHFAGDGSVSVSMQRGLEYVVRILEGGCHILTFEFSLIFVSAVDKKGMQTRFVIAQCDIS